MLCFGQLLPLAGSCNLCNYEGRQEFQQFRIDAFDAFPSVEVAFKSCHCFWSTRTVIVCSSKDLGSTTAQRRVKCLKFELCIHDFACLPTLPRYKIMLAASAVGISSLTIVGEKENESKLVTSFFSISAYFRNMVAKSLHSMQSSILYYNFVKTS